MITATMTSVTAASNINIDLEIRDGSNNTIATKPQKTFGGIYFSAGQEQTFTWNYLIPANTPLGVFYLDVAAFSADWSQTYFWDSNVTSITFAKSNSNLSNLSLPGINFSGGENNSGYLNAKQYTDYIYPSTAEMQYVASKGMKVIRVPFDISRIQPEALAALSNSYLSELDTVIQNASQCGLNVILDPHNYGYMMDTIGMTTATSGKDTASWGLIGTTSDTHLPTNAFSNFWGQMATHYKNQPNVIFGLMNEPNVQTAAQWQAAAASAVAAIRASGATQKILISGTSWTGAHSWVTSGNAAAWAGFKDSNFAFDVHEYLDYDYSGTHVQCLSGAGSATLVDFTNWARAQGVTGFLGETGWSTDPSCPPEGLAEMNYMENNSDVWEGYTYWAAGAWLGSYMFSIEPIGLGTPNVQDAPQMSILLQNL